MKNAFTLAEVLITLGIIGVVAALTIPNLIANYKEKQSIAHWKKMYSVISQAYLSTIAEGYQPCNPTADRGRTCPDRGIIDSGTWTFQTALNTEFLDKFTSKFNYTDICKGEAICRDKTKYMPSYYRRYKTLKGGTVGAYNNGSYGFRLVSGEVIMYGASHGGPWISVDLNSYENGPNVVGKDVFIMKAYDTGIKALGSKGTFNIDYNGDECLCGKEYGVETNSYYAGGAGFGEVISGGCCSAVYLNK